MSEASGKLVGSAREAAQRSYELLEQVRRERESAARGTAVILERLQSHQSRARLLGGDGIDQLQLARPGKGQSCATAWKEAMVAGPSRVCPGPCSIQIRSASRLSHADVAWSATK